MVIDFGVFFFAWLTCNFPPNYDDNLFCIENFLDVQAQLNLQTRDTMGSTILSLVERSSLSQRSNDMLKC